MYICMCKCMPSSCGLDKQAHHMWRCVLTAWSNKGYSRARCLWQTMTLAHPHGQTRCSFNLLVFTLEPYIFFFLSKSLQYSLFLSASFFIKCFHLLSHSILSYTDTLSRCGLAQRNAVKLAFYLSYQPAASVLPAMPSI